MLPGERRRPDSWTCWTSCRTQTQAGTRAGGRVSFPLCLLIYFGSSTSETPEMSRLPAAGPRSADRCPASQSLSRGDPGSCSTEKARAVRREPPVTRPPPSGLLDSPTPTPPAAPDSALSRPWDLHPLVSLLVTIPGSPAHPSPPPTAPPALPLCSAGSDASSAFPDGPPSPALAPATSRLPLMPLDFLLPSHHAFHHVSPYGPSPPQG